MFTFMHIDNAFYSLENYFRGLAFPIRLSVTLELGHIYLCGVFYVSVILYPPLPAHAYLINK